MQLLDEHLLQIYNEGKISAEEAVDKSRRPAELAERMGKRMNRPDTDTEPAPPERPTSGGSR
jgi:hypothetical protein